MVTSFAVLADAGTLTELQKMRRNNKVIQSPTLVLLLHIRVRVKKAPSCVLSLLWMKLSEHVDQSTVLHEVLKRFPFQSGAPRYLGLNPKYVDIVVDHV